MDIYRHAAMAAKSDRHEVASVAASLRDDFSGLVAIFDRHLARPLDEGEAKRALSDAKSAAQRGLELSQHLIGLLRQPYG